MAIKQAKIQHVAVIPYPAQGHINPLLQLCQQLVPHGFTFTFINTDHIHRRIHRVRHMHPAHHEHDAHAPDGHQDKDNAHGPYDENVHIHTAHNDQVTNPNDAHHCDDARVFAHDAHDKDAAHVDGVHHHKGCSSIRMVSVEGGCAPEQHAHPSSATEAFKAAQEMQEPVEKLLSNIMKEQSVAFILSDVLLGWSSATAHKFGLPWVCFWPASTATFSVFIHFRDLAAQGEVISIAEKEGGEAPLMEGIPGLPPTHLHDLPRTWDDTGKLHHSVFKYFQQAEQASFVLFNTFAELEGQVLEALSKRLPALAVGPLLPSHYLLPTCPDSKEELSPSRPSLFLEDNSCLEWLDKQAPSSVLFISFGSISLRSEEQLEELAKGVEASGCPFLWVRRPNHKPDISQEHGPHKSQQERGHLLGQDDGLTHENGHFHGQENGFKHEEGHPHSLIVPWAPQLQVLSHPSVGGFITHCGWNSVMESVSMGVPMICWADSGERMSNQRFVVEFWKCGVHMVADNRRITQHIDEAVLVRRDEVEKSVRFLMFEEGGASIRARATQLRDASIIAFQDSNTHLNEFTQVMEQKHTQTLR
eukprot:c19718_g1_i1 orf=221-1981(-)